MRATGYPGYYDFNLVRVEDEPGLSVDALVAFADEALAGVEHRRIDFDLVEAGDARRAGFEELGWKAERLLWMRHDGAPPGGPVADVEQVDYDAVRGLREAWHEEDFPGQDASIYVEHAREVSMRRGVQVLAVREGGAPIGFAQVERDGDAAEVTQVYVSPDHRGGGRGTALTRAAIAASGDVRDLWIVADDEDRPKELYARLGFRTAWTTMESTRWPDPAPVG